MRTELQPVSSMQAETRLQAGVSTAFPLATDAAVDMLKRGGNAVDGAIAAAWALSVCEPSASGLGGQTTLLLRTSDGEFHAIDGHSCAPRKVSASNVDSQQQRRGYRACTIPSTAATLQYAHGQHGRLPWRELMTPAIEMAERGYHVTALQSKQIGWVTKYLSANPAAAGVFLRGGRALEAGDILRQPKLAEALSWIAECGAGIFYTGKLAQQIADDMRENGGLLDERDLQDFPGPQEREPISIKFRGFKITTIPPPGGGLQLLLALKVFERLLPSSKKASLDDWYEAVARATVAAFTARQERESLAFEPPRNLAALLSDDHASELVARMTRPAVANNAGAEEPGDTTHLTVADGEGNVVTLTQSIQSVFGAKVANGRLGFIYNNYLHTCRRQSGGSQLGSGCLPRSNAAPVFVTCGDSPVLALGSAGSRRIISSILQVISGVLDRELPIQQAIDAPRVHGLLNQKVWIEKSIATPSLIDRLGKSFRKIVFKRNRSFGMGAVHALEFFGEGTRAGADPRRDGTAKALAQDGPASGVDRHGK